jgi:AsmA protein
LSADAECDGTAEPAGSGGGPLRKSRAPFAIATAGGLVALAAATVKLAPWLYSPDAALPAVAAQLQSAAGLYVAPRGATYFFLTPRPHIRIEGVAFADHRGALVIEAEAAEGAVALSSLLSGRPSLSSLTLVRPRAVLDLDKAPVEAPGAATRAAAAQPATPAAQKADAFALGALTVVEGALRVRRDGVEHVVERIDGALDWPRVGEPAALTAAFDWRGERLQAMLWVARPSMLLRGDPSVATARLDGENLKLEAQGVAQLGVDARFGGRIAGSAASARAALALFGLETPLPGPFLDARFATEATVSPRHATFGKLEFAVDGAVFQGEAALRAEDGRPALSATLESDFVPLKPMFADVPAPVGADGQWSREPLAPPDLSAIDMDLRLSVRRARLGRVTLDEAHMLATLRDGALDLSLTEAQAYRGRLKAHATFTPAPGGALIMHAAAQTAGVDAQALLRDAFGRPGIGGALDAAATLDARGASVAEMVRGLDGRVALTLTDGEIAGVDFDRALRRLEKRPLASALDIRSGSSTLAEAKAAFTIDSGVAAVENGQARGPGFALDFRGEANLAERSLSFKAAAREADAGGAPTEKGAQIAFDLLGGWDEPKLAPDPKSFIRRSGAAAPLLPGPP